MDGPIPRSIWAAPIRTGGFKKLEGSWKGGGECAQKYIVSSSVRTNRNCCLFVLNEILLLFQGILKIKF